MAFFKRANKTIDVAVEAGTRIVGGGTATWLTHALTSAIAHAPEVEACLGNGGLGNSVQGLIEYGLPAVLIYKTLKLGYDAIEKIVTR